MKKSSTLLGNQRGIVLIAVLALVAATAVIVFEIQRQSRGSKLRSASLQERYQLNEMATSAVHFGMAVLAEDKKHSVADSINERWADAQRLSEWIERSAFETGKTRLRITDELSKIQVNAIVDDRAPGRVAVIQKNLWDGMLNQFEILESDRDARLGRLSSLSQRVARSPLASLDDLTTVHEWSILLIQLSSRPDGWREYLTVYGQARPGYLPYSGTININTAGAVVLASLIPEQSRVLADRLVAYRGSLAGDTADEILQNATWYKMVPGCEHLNLDQRLISIRSDIFRIHAVSEHNGRQTAIVAIIQRIPLGGSKRWDCIILNWRVVG